MPHYDKHEPFKIQDFHRLNTTFMSKTEHEKGGGGL